MWVADDNNARVVGFDNAATLADGANADRVLGQPDFTSNSRSTTQNGLDGSSGVSTDCVGNLYIADDGNDRVLVFLDPLSKSNGANADFVLGQPDFTTGTSSTTQNGLNLETTSGLALCDNLLFIADGNNQRVIVQEATNLCVPPEEPVVIEPIPTMSEWGLIIFGLLVLNLGVLFIVRKNELLV